jgi:multidrug efflux pump subunit AcrB
MAGGNKMNLSEPFIRRPVATSPITAALALLGLVAFPFLPVAPLPQVDFPTITVVGNLAGASAETMASSVAAPLERQFGQIPGVTQLTSTSTLGVTNVVTSSTSTATSMLLPRMSRPRLRRPADTCRKQ